MSQTNLRLGIDLFAQAPHTYVKNRKVALLCHAASVTQEFKHLTQIAAEAKLNVIQCFGPEHGIWADAQDMEAVEHQVQLEPNTQAPVHSLYGHTLEQLTPTAQSLEGVELLIIDLQDIGTRYYTYIYTACLCVMRCAELNIEVLILDRPNPLGGVEVEGNYTGKEYTSFVGMWPLPNRHGLTLAEVVSLINHRQGWEANIEVIEVQGWQREEMLNSTGQTWVIPSPNMPSFEAMLVYPGMCLIEGTEMSEARGTTKPFEWVGAGFINPFEWAQELNQLPLKGVQFRPLFYKPTFHKWAHQTIGGVQIQILDPLLVQPFRLGLHLLALTRRLYGEALKWRKEAYEFVEDQLAIDLLFGDSEARELIDSYASIEEIEAYWQRCQLGAEEFKQERQNFLRY